MPTNFVTREDMLAFQGPALVLTDNLFSVKSALIRLGQRNLQQHVSGRYQHIVWLESSGVVVSQDWTLKRRLLADYLKGDHRVKMFVDSNWPQEHKNRIHLQLQEDLKGKHRYDWLGIIGHLLRMPRINFPNRWYCSEHVVHVLRLVDSRFENKQQITPSAMDVWLRSYQYEVLGVFDPYED